MAIGGFMKQAFAGNFLGIVNDANIEAIKNLVALEANAAAKIEVFGEVKDSLIQITHLLQKAFLKTQKAEMA